MDYKPAKWPLKAILKAPGLWWHGVMIDYHLKKGIRAQVKANKHNRIAGIMLNLIGSEEASLPSDEQLWLIFVDAPAGQGKTTVQEWHMWGQANSVAMQEFLSRIPGKVMWIKNITQIRTDIFTTMTRPPQVTVPVMPGETKWIQ